MRSVTYPDPNQCPHCGRPDEGNAGDYYHRKECEARAIQRRIDTEGDTPELREALERARYVGD